MKAEGDKNDSQIASAHWPKAYFTVAWGIALLFIHKYQE